MTRRRGIRRRLRLFLGLLLLPAWVSSQPADDNYTARRRMAIREVARLNEIALPLEDVVDLAKLKDLDAGVDTGRDDHRFKALSFAPPLATVAVQPATTNLISYALEGRVPSQTDPAVDTLAITNQFLLEKITALLRAKDPKKPLDAYSVSEIKNVILESKFVLSPNEAKRLALTQGSATVKDLLSARGRLVGKLRATNVAATRGAPDETVGRQDSLRAAAPGGKNVGTPQVKTGDKIITTVKLTKNSDVRFDVLRGMTIILHTRPGVFDHQDIYQVEPTDHDIQYSWTFLFGTDEGEYTIALAVNGENKCGGAAKAINGRGPYQGDCLFERQP